MIRATIERQILRSLIQHRMYCRACSAVCDVRRDVMIDAEDRDGATVAIMLLCRSCAEQVIGPIRVAGDALVWTDALESCAMRTASAHGGDVRIGVIAGYLPDRFGYLHLPYYTATGAADGSTDRARQLTIGGEE